MPMYFSCYTVHIYQVKYKGKKLDQFKTTWFRKQNSPASSMREAPTTSKQEAHASTPKSQPVHVSSHKPPPKKTSSSHFGEKQDLGSSSSLSSSFHSPPPSTSQSATSPNNSGHRVSGASVAASNSGPLPAEIKRPTKTPHSSGRGRKPNIGYIHPLPQTQVPQKSPLSFNPSPSTLSSSSKSSGSLRSPVGRNVSFY
ncbi:PREDICTED: uncharacterized protein LOC107354644 [Acropora digitifera]|uniref:uncharacterized protein LOC107354644 n=1 Tax=Acropora digitifera TaxID=70779 RepID=UPI00077B18CB|nr:PREDICTED: uncharacterized protein LOC107354644 [Acropora digitifera]